MPVERCFVDTNVLVYSTVAGNPWHEAARQWLTELYAQDIQLCVSPQILREYLVVLTRGQVFTVEFTVGQALATLEGLLPGLALLSDTPVGIPRPGRLRACCIGSPLTVERCS